MIWILVAHRADARLFKSSGKRGDLRLAREFDYPDGRRQNREIDTDGSGKRFVSTGGRDKATQHGLDPQMEAAEYLTDVFAKELALILRDGRTHNEYDEVILVAEAGFLGKIRKFLDKATSRMVSEARNL